LRARRKGERVVISLQPAISSLRSFGLDTGAPSGKSGSVDCPSIRI